MPVMLPPCTLSLDGLLILNRLWQDRRITTAEAAHLVQKPEAETRASLETLAESGLIERHGEHKARTWHLSAATYRRLGEESGYIRQRGFEPLQQEQMVLQYAESHGRITRGQVAELCKITPGQASRLLRQLTVRGEIKAHGEKKGRWYSRKRRP